MVPGPPETPPAPSDPAGHGLMEGRVPSRPAEWPEIQVAGMARSYAAPRITAWISPTPARWTPMTVYWWRPPCMRSMSMTAPTGTVWSSRITGKRADGGALVPQSSYAGQSIQKGLCKCHSHLTPVYAHNAPSGQNSIQIRLPVKIAKHMSTYLCLCVRSGEREEVLFSCICIVTTRHQCRYYTVYVLLTGLTWVL